MDNFFSYLDSGIAVLGFGAALFVPFVVLFYSGARATAVDLRAAFTRSPLKTLCEIAFALGYIAFFSSLLLASIGINTFWR